MTEERRPILPTTASTAKWQRNQLSRGLCAECAQPIDRTLSKRLCPTHLEAHATFARQYREKIRGQNSIAVDAWKRRQSQRQVARLAHAFPGSEEINFTSPLPSPTVHQPVAVDRAAQYREASKRGPTYTISRADRKSEVLSWPRQTSPKSQKSQTSLVAPKTTKQDRKGTTKRKLETVPARQGTKLGAKLRGKPRRA